MKHFFSILAACLMLFSFTAPANAQKTQKEAKPAAIVSDVMQDGLRIVNYRPDEIVCSVNIEIKLRGDVIEEVQYTKGCPGNQKGIAILVKGMKMDEAIEKLQGITCGRRPTSCPDQLANALIAIKKAKPSKKK